MPNWFSFVFTYKGDNQSKQGFFNAIVLVMETGFAGKSTGFYAGLKRRFILTRHLVTAFLAIFLNLILAEEIEDEAPLLTANEADASDDAEEWRQIQHGKASGTGTDEEVTEKSA